MWIGKKRGAMIERAGRDIIRMTFGSGTNLGREQWVEVLSEMGEEPKESGNPCHTG